MQSKSQDIFKGCVKIGLRYEKEHVFLTFQY